MAAVDIAWNPGLLSGVTLALRASLGRVPWDSVRGTPVEQNWLKAQEWLNLVEPMTTRQTDQSALEHVPDFPLSSLELQALQASIDRIAQARATVSATKAGPTAKHARRSIQRVSSSAYALAIFLAAWSGITVVNLTVFHGISTYLLTLSLTCSALALALWILHFTRIGRHKAILKQIHPIL